MKIHQYILPSGKIMYYGHIKQFWGIKQSYFESDSRRVLLAYMFNSFLPDKDEEPGIISPYYENTQITKK